MKIKCEQQKSFYKRQIAIRKIPFHHHKSLGISLGSVIPLHNTLRRDHDKNYKHIYPELQTENRYIIQAYDCLFNFSAENYQFKQGIK